MLKAIYSLLCKISILIKYNPINALQQSIMDSEERLLIDALIDAVEATASQTQSTLQS
jgi:hypothetical protein